MTGDEVKTVAVVGAGTMGPGMAATFARHGFDVRLTDVKEENLEKAKGMVDVVYNALIGGGFITAADADQGRANISYTLDLAGAVDGADFVLEAVPEKLEIKHSFFANVEKLVRDDTILASNTSGILITKIAEAVDKPGRLVGMHWSNPPHMIPVIEVIRGEQTDDAAVEATRRVTERIGMIPVLVKKDVPGFVENRILYAIMREALHLLDEGVASPADIDVITKWGIGYKLAVIGPLELLDVAGLDIYHSVASYLNADLSDSKGVSSTIGDKVEAGTLGIKTGGGLFEYQPGEIPGLMQRRVKLLMEVKKALSQSAT
jgi:3-hydroxybutyryl-CoA dehydrogenase/5-formyl-3-hydroxy-2-methylpyridine 4-carboxylate dehydrogenase